MRTIGRKWPEAQGPDRQALCSYCGVQWRRSQLTRDPSANLACPDCAPGLDIVSLTEGNARLMRSRQPKTVGPSDGNYDQFTSPPSPGFVNPNGPPPNTYVPLGYVGTRAMASAITSASAGPYSFRFPFYATDALNGPISVAWANWYNNELFTVGSVLTILGAYFEYPNGTLVPITFGGGPMTPGGTTVGVAAPGANIWGNVSVSGVALGDLCYLRYCLQGSASPSLYWNNGVNINVNLGERAAPGTNLIGAMANLQIEMTRPVAVVGYTRRKSYAIIGDSTQTDTWGDGNIPAPGSVGQIARGFRDIIGYANFGIGGASLAQWVATHSKRDELILPYAYGILNGYGAVDVLVNGVSAAQYKLNVQAHRAMYPRQRYWVKTVDQQVQSSNSWIDAVNQGPPIWGAPGEAQRVIYVKDLVAHPTDIGDGILETTAFTEYLGTGNSGKWVFDGTVNYATIDGAHSSQAMFARYSFPGFGGPLP